MHKCARGTSHLIRAWTNPGRNSTWHQIGQNHHSRKTRRTGAVTIRTRRFRQSIVSEPTTQSPKGQCFGIFSTCKSLENHKIWLSIQQHIQISPNGANCDTKVAPERHGETALLTKPSIRNSENLKQITYTQRGLCLSHSDDDPSYLTFLWDT